MLFVHTHIARLHRNMALGLSTLLLAACSAAPTDATSRRIRVSGSTAWGPETPPFNDEIILRDPAGGGAQGHVKFRQPNDANQIVYLDTWVRDLNPNAHYRLQRATDGTVNDNCTGTNWLTLGKGSTPQDIVTDDRGTGREELFRDLGASAAGSAFDIHFRIIDASAAVVLESDCYQFVISP